MTGERSKIQSGEFPVLRSVLEINGIALLYCIILMYHKTHDCKEEYIAVG